MHLPLTILTLIGLASAQGSQGTGKTTRYWDCCKPSCAWPGKSTASTPVLTCDRNDNPLNDRGSTRSGCDSGGSAFMCSNQSPWAVNETVAYGWAAVNIAGSNEASWCCSCYELTFTSGPVSGKKMIVQATNTGGDLGNNHFDIAMPGGGVGIFNACTQQYGAPPDGWGERYGGVGSKDACASFPEKLKAGCNWRFDWFMGADNPNVSFRQVACPAAITAKTQCVRQRDVIDQTPTGPSTVPTWTPSP
ncbi:RlpA-like double-psi beta-barrel-protein domain-containing protein-containing protein [Triangularia verruculosa]|uniref:Cellulase n=1 Tax=Triangularia verruculosa TaxID=2587418 RepID=A0AAN6XAM3_9PEZI|nr:RlpA-like double-psi beta-barrel-protein domain-containing protein-containing protein [Triangularia verruculosa]